MVVHVLASEHGGQEGQHMGVVTKALVKVARTLHNPSGLFMTCRDPERHKASIV